MSARARIKNTASILKVVHNIPDLGDAPDIAPGHIAEAIQYRQSLFQV